jgi:hypothetical protein
VNEVDEIGPPPLNRRHAVSSKYSAGFSHVDNAVSTPADPLAGATIRFARCGGFWRR